MNYYTTVEEMRKLANEAVECDRGANMNLRADYLESVEKAINNLKPTEEDLENIEWYLEDIEAGFYEDKNLERLSKIQELNKKYETLAKTKTPIKIKITNVVTLYEGSPKKDNDYIVDIYTDNTDSSDCYDLEEAKEDDKYPMTDNYEESDTACKVLVDSCLATVEGKGAYFTTLLRDSVEETFYSYSLKGTFEEADGASITLDVLKLLDYGHIVLYASPVELPIILSNIQDLNECWYLSKVPLEITYKTEFYY